VSIDKATRCRSGATIWTSARRAGGARSGASSEALDGPDDPSAREALSTQPKSSRPPSRPRQRWLYWFRSVRGAPGARPSSASRQGCFPGRTFYEHLITEVSLCVPATVKDTNIIPGIYAVQAIRDTVGTDVTAPHRLTVGGVDDPVVGRIARECSTANGVIDVLASDVRRSSAAGAGC
jgi:hypothetical protein